MTEMTEIKEKHLEYCTTDIQRGYVQAILDHTTQKAAAESLGVTASTVAQCLRLVLGRAESVGYSPKHHMTHPVPPGFLAKRVSTYHKASDIGPAQWVCGSLDMAQQAAAQEAAYRAMAKDLPPLAPSAPRDGELDGQLCNLHVLSDVHLGMLAWERETGAAWDLVEGLRVVRGAWAQAIDRAPRAKKAVVAILGDFFHSDGLKPVTPASGHVLDQSNRYPEIIEAGVEMLRQVFASALAHHESVHVVIAEGNHDPVGSMWLRTMFSALYADEPRLTVCDSVLPYYGMEHGEVMIGFHHGHIKSIQGAGAAALALLFANRPEWQDKAHRYIHTGHKHHVAVATVPGCQLIQHATLAAPDAYSARGGWDSSRCMTTTTYHSKFGKVGELTVTPEMIQ
jgi:hypothetical protein